LALRADVARGAAAQINPRLGASWHDATGRTRLHASAGRTSKLPSFFALASPPALGGNPALRPERTWGGELGLRHDLRAARLALGATMFRHEYRDLVDFDFDLFTHLNRARVHAHGVELSLAWKPHPALSLESDATHLLARDPSGAALGGHEPRDLACATHAGLAARVARRGAGTGPPDPGAGTRPGGGLRRVGQLGLVAGAWALDAACARRQLEQPRLRNLRGLPWATPRVLAGARLAPALSARSPAVTPRRTVAFDGYDLGASAMPPSTSTYS
jgi:outer membrane receptor protein involved in Fe transport